tara:strand:- start:234 stop:605 length:372 start_codon:yes stop_codon:yes gene_type:complete
LTTIVAKKCDLQVDDCIGGFDWCEGCDAIICWECCAKLKIRERPTRTKRGNIDKPGKRLTKYEWGFTEMGVTEENAEEYDYSLFSCPYCVKLDRAKVDAKLLKFLLKQSGLTRSKAVKAMNSG